MPTAGAMFGHLPDQVQVWLRPGFEPEPDLTVWEWAREHVDFSLVPNYDTPIHGRYDPDFMPYWKEPAEMLTDPDTDEIIIKKCTRAGASENCILNPIRYTVACRPRPALYITGDQIAAKSFMEKRIVRGLRASIPTREQLSRANAREYDVEFPAMDLRVTWPKNRMAFKQDGWAIVFIDEASLLPPGTDDMARKRVASYPFAKVIMVSSPDPLQKRASRDDPIFANYRRGDQRQWFVQYGKKTKPFTFEMGTKLPFGLRWSEKCRKKDGTWDLDGVTETAHFLTPDGKIIKENDRIEVVAGGQWVPTVSAQSRIRSYHCNAFMTPFDSFGSIAAAFLSAKARGKVQLRTMIYELLAEEWDQDVEAFDEKLLHSRIGDYLRGSNLFEDATDILRLMTVDQQKDHYWYVIRDWTASGESCLVDWGRILSYDDIDKVAEKFKPQFVGIDSGYGQRTQEVYVESLFRDYVPMKGDEKAKPGLSLFSVTPINPYEGTRRQQEGVSVGLVVFHSDTAQLMLAERLKGERSGWYLYRGVERDYLQQLSSASRGPTGWDYKGDNHLWDCETMQIILAARYGYLYTGAAGSEDPAQE